MTLPNGYYSGLTVRLDLAELAETSAGAAGGGRRIR